MYGISHHIHLMDSEVREQDHHVFLHSDNQSSVSLIPATDHFHVISNLEGFLQVTGIELQRVLKV